MNDASDRDAASTLGLTEPEAAALQEALAYRESAEVQEALAAEKRDFTAFEAELPGLGVELAKRVSPKAYALIVQHETGGRKYYEKVYGARPVWPKGSSGVTIGFGYDLGYVSEAEFRKDWAVLETPALDRFVHAHVLGARGGRKSASEMRDLRAQVSDIAITWEIAETVFRTATLPKFALLTYRHLPNCDALNGDCFGALVSLTFNRGASYEMTGASGPDGKDRYFEMRAIKKAMASAEYAKIPALIRTMIRVWIGTVIETEMRRRREDEARLFEEGLTALAVTLAAAGRKPAPEAMVFAEAAAGASDEDRWEELSEEDAAAAAEQRARRGVDGEIVLAAALANTVAWAPDDQSPDYAHLHNQLPFGLDFTLKAGDLELLAKLNGFPVEEAGDTPILFGLRGCRISKGASSGDGAWREEVILSDIRPNHRDTLCVFGVWRSKDKSIGVFSGSTVPNVTAVTSWYNTRNAGNLLPTGLYRYIVGPHNGKPGCFLLRKTLDEKRVVVVRRSENNLMYDLPDIFDVCGPGDNLHPAFNSTEHYFSSYGCQVVSGSADANGHHSGPWAKFRQMAGLKDATGVPGTPYLYMLLTGREAYLASDLRRKELATDTLSLRPLQRLRFGSKNTLVGDLQVKLGLQQSEPDFGPMTAKLLHERQRRLTPQASDGIYSPELDARLGWGVFSATGV